MRTYERKPHVESAGEERGIDPPPPHLLKPVPVGGLSVGTADAPAERAAVALAETAFARLQRLSRRGSGGAAVPESGDRTVLSRLPRSATPGTADAPAERAADALAETAFARLQRLSRRGSGGAAVPESGDRTVLSRLPRSTTPGPAVAIGRAGGSLDPVTGAEIKSRLGHGPGLPEPARSRMEVAFGTSLGHVRVHDDATAGKLNDAISAQAFTLGNDIFVGRGVAPAVPSAEHVLAHEIAHVLTEPGDIGRLRRWFQPRPPPSPQPVSTQPPRGRNQTPLVRWDEVKEVPRGVYRFVDADNKGWEAAEGKLSWRQTDWHRAAEMAAATAETWWYDVTAAKWVKGAQPETHREALDKERPAPLVGDLHGYSSAEAVPVFVKAKYRMKLDSKKTKGTRDAEQRTMDRYARLLMTGKTGNAREGTPHLATATTGGLLHVAGNTGTRHVSSQDATRGKTALSDAVDPTKWLPQGRRAQKDAIKLRALQSGDYPAHHSNARGLEALSTVLTKEPQWHNVDVSTGSSEHGEMTVLAQVHAELKANPNRTAGRIVKNLGGVKLACGACDLAFQAYNDFIAAPLGYLIKVSGTHGVFYSGWKAPKFILDVPAAVAYIEENLPIGSFLERGVLLGVEESDPAYENPDESDSEWEEV